MGLSGLLKFLGAFVKNVNTFSTATSIMYFAVIIFYQCPVTRFLLTALRMAQNDLCEAATATLSIHARAFRFSFANSSAVVRNWKLKTLNVHFRYEAGEKKDENSGDMYYARDAGVAAATYRCHQQQQQQHVQRQHRRPTTFYVNMFVCLSFVSGSNPFLARFCLLPLLPVCRLVFCVCFFFTTPLCSFAKCCLLIVIVGAVAILLLFFPTLLVPLLNIHLLFTLLATFEQQKQQQQ